MHYIEDKYYFIYIFSRKKLQYDIRIKECKICVIMGSRGNAFVLSFYYVYGIFIKWETYTYAHYYHDFLNYIVEAN